MVKKALKFKKLIWNYILKKIYWILSKLFSLLNFKKSYANLLWQLSLQRRLTSFYISEAIWIKIMYIKLNFNQKLKYLFKFRLIQTSWLFYPLKNRQRININSFLFGIQYIWESIRLWIVGLILFIGSFYYFSYVRLLPFNKVLIEWLLIVMLLYWLLSGFVFFIKKYQFSKFTSVIQRFWKRTYILFWLIEGGIFLCFFYLTMNSSSEPFYMYDQMKVYKQHLFSWRWFMLKLIPSVFIIMLTYYLQLVLKWNIFYKQNSIILTITIILLYIVWLEFYQFFHIINFYGNLNWVYDSEEFLWNLEIEFRRTRLFNNYIAICLLAKFWHLIFIFVFWIFFVLRINETNRVRYPLLAANYQNFIFLYVMTWLYMSPWLKFVFRKQLDVSYYWFFTNAKTVFLSFLLVDLKLFLTNFSSFFFTLYNWNSLNYSFFYWIEASTLVDFDQYRKHVIRDLLIRQLNG